MLVVAIDLQAETYKTSHFYDRFISIGKRNGSKWILREVAPPSTIKTTHWKHLPVFPKQTFYSWLRTKLTVVLLPKEEKKRLKGKRIIVRDEVR